jgi:F0F1-type ATP synthase assembly protein I
MLGRGQNAGRALGEGYRFLGIGMQFAGGIVFFTLGGVALDRWLGLVPLFTIIGTLLGATLSFINVYIKLQAFADAEAKRKKAEKQK